MKSKLFSPFIQNSELAGEDLLEMVDEPGCLLCGEIPTKGLLCERCQKHSIISPLSFVDLPFALSIISIIFSFILFKGNNIKHVYLLSPFNTEMEIGFLFIALALFASLLFMIENRSHVVRMENLYRSMLFISIIIAPLSLIPLFTMGPGPLQIILPIFIFSIAIILLIPNMKLIYENDKISFFVHAIGSVIVTLGFHLSIKGADQDFLIWFISGEHIIIIGFLLISIAIFRIMNILSSGTRISFVSLSLSLSSSILFITGFSIIVWGNEGTFDETFVMISLFLLLLSLIGMMNIRTKDALILSKFKQLKASIEKARKLKEKGREFYALQQYDRAIMLNPIHQLGLPYNEGSIVSKVERRLTKKELSFEPSEYEVSYNEKAKILASQGRFVEAVKQFKESIRKRPEYILTYLELSMLLASIIGKRNESDKQLKYYITSKILYIRRMYRADITPEVLWWMIISFHFYLRTLREKRDILINLSKDGDIWGYFTLGKG